MTGFNAEPLLLTVLETVAKLEEKKLLEIAAKLGAAVKTSVEGSQMQFDDFARAQLLQFFDAFREAAA